MALALLFEDQLSREIVSDYTALADRHGVDRGCISRIMQLSLLAPDLQAVLLASPELPIALNLKQMLPVCRTFSWEAQRISFQQLLDDARQKAQF